MEATSKTGIRIIGKILKEFIKLKYVLTLVEVYLVKLFSTGNRYKTRDIINIRYDIKKKNEKLHKFENVIKNINTNYIINNNPNN